MARKGIEWNGKESKWMALETPNGTHSTLINNNE